jgi:hypothetical protein
VTLAFFPVFLLFSPFLHCFFSSLYHSHLFFFLFSLPLFLELENEVVGAIEGDKENSKENNRNDALAAQLLEITQGM